MADLFSVVFCALSLSLTLRTSQALSTSQSLSYNDLKPCNLSSVEMASLSPSAIIVPCIAWDVAPNVSISSKNESLAQSPLANVIQVTPPQCSNHRDGAPTAVELLNALNDGRGPSIGYKEDYYVQFRFVAVVAGSIANDVEAGQEHEAILKSMLETLNPQYIMGTCTFVATLEQQIALDYKRILMAQVGPPDFYTTDNPYVFGFHLSSDNYGRPAMQALRFYATSQLKGGLSAQPVRIIYQSEPDFFRSTCQAISKMAQKYGFTDTVEYQFDPSADHDNDTITDLLDVDFQTNLSDSVCPPRSDTDVFPAIFVCASGNEDVVLRRWRENGCRPVSMWMTQATLEWATDNPDLVPYIQGPAQWHPTFSYSDDFFESGAKFLSFQEQKLGYKGTYDMLASYSIMALFSKHIHWLNRNVDNPTVEEDFSSETGYETVRRNMLVLKTDTLFGPFYIPVNQMQNNGREPASTQWLPDAQFNNSIQNKCTSPSSEADSEIETPSPASKACEPGASVSLVATRHDPSLLTSKCVACAIKTYSPSVGADCIPCPGGASTHNETGATACMITDDNILSRPLLSMAFMFVCIVWSLGLSMLAWILRHKDDQILKTSRHYMSLMIAGAMLSTTSLMTISFDAGTGSKSTLATVGCQITPFLYTIGWALQLGSVAGLAYPVSRRAWNPHIHSYVEPRSPWPLYISISFDLFVCILWTVLSPMEYSRWSVSEVVDPNAGTTTIGTVGFCSASGHDSLWAFAGPIALCHAALLIRIGVLYTTNRTREDKFGQRLYCLFAALYAAQLLLIGVPLVVAVGENTTARYALLCWLVFGSDVGVTSLIFFPIRARRKSSEEYAVGQQLSKRQKKKKKKEKANAIQKAMEREKKMSAFQDSQFHRGFDSLDLDDLRSLHDSDAEDGAADRASQAIGSYDVTG